MKKLLLLHLPTEKRLLLLISSIMVILLAIGGGFIYRASETTKAQTEVTADATIVRSLDNLFINLLNAETGQRGYVLTGNPSYLTPYTDSLPVIASDMKILKTSLPVTEQNQEFMSQLQSSIDAKLAELQDSIRVRRTEGFTTALAIVNSNYGKTQMDDIRILIGPQRNFYIQDIQLKQGSERRQLRFTMIFGVVGSILFLIFVVVASRQILADLQQRRLLLEHVEHAATHDALTGLSNRSYFVEFLEYALKAVARDGAKLALLYIDLDGFKHLNDTLGHAAGDDALRLVAKLFQQTKREVDVLTRLGGDEFAIVVPRISDESSVETFANRLLRSLEDPDMQALAPGLGASIGIASYPRDAQSSSALVEAADKAMYRAKSAGGHQACSSALR